MNKFTLMVLALFAWAGMARGEMDDKTYDQTVVAAGVSTNSYVLRGILEAVSVDVTAPATSTVTVVTSNGRTLFTLAGIAADATYYPTAAAHTTAGAAATFVGGGDTNQVANAWRTKQAMAGSVSVILTGQNGAAVTNRTLTTLIFSK